MNTFAALLLFIYSFVLRSQVTDDVRLKMFHSGYSPPDFCLVPTFSCVEAGITLSVQAFPTVNQEVYQALCPVPHSFGKPLVKTGLSARLFELIIGPYPISANRNIELYHTVT